MKPSFRWVAQPRGVALLTVLWALGILSLAMIPFAGILQSIVGQQISLQAGTRALLAAESGIEMMRNPAVNESNHQQATSQVNAILYGSQGKDGGGGIGFNVEVEREGALLDLNRLAADPARCREVLGPLFKVYWEIDAQIADAAIDSLIDWVDPDDKEQLNGAEKRDYSKRGLPGPRDGPMVWRDEYRRVLGWRNLENQAKEKPDLNDWFTVSGAEKLDLSTARRELVEVVLSLPPGKAENFLARRNGLDGKLGTPDDIRDIPTAANLLGARPELVEQRASFQGRLRVISTGKVGDVTRRIEAVLSDGFPRKIESRYVLP